MKRERERRERERESFALFLCLSVSSKQERSSCLLCSVLGFIGNVIAPLCGVTDVMV